MSQGKKHFVFLGFVLGLFLVFHVLSKLKEDPQASLKKGGVVSSHPLWEEGRRLFQALQCTQCHLYQGQGGTRGPDLTQLPHTLSVRLARYPEELERLEKKHPQEYATFLPYYQRILAVQGDERVRLWLYEHLKAPYFDHPETTMPTFGLKEEQIQALMVFLLEPPKK
jgi:cytochrome c2